MKASIIIPVWNGIPDILDCLRAVYANAESTPFQVICVDNSSSDDSVVQIQNGFPQVHLVCQPTNLGFAGAVNVGMDTAEGDVFILLNQDVNIHKDWYNTLMDAMAGSPQFGIFGCKILNTDGSINHTGAYIHRPDATGIHLTEDKEDLVSPADYVTGAAMAIRRSAWEIVGYFDEGYYPAYYEDVDYCYRARRKGIETGCVNHAVATHLFSSDEWQVDPIKHTSNGYISRYRFVSKHFNILEISKFFDAEVTAIEETEYIDHAIGRVIAARHTLRTLPRILRQRQADLDDTISQAGDRLLQVGFTRILKLGFQQAENMTIPKSEDNPKPEIPEKPDRWQKEFVPLEQSNFSLLEFPPFTEDNKWIDRWRMNTDALQELLYNEHELQLKINLRSPSDPQPENMLKRLHRLLIKRTVNILSGRQDQLRSDLIQIQENRIKELIQRIDLSIESNRRYQQYLELIHEQLRRTSKLWGENIIEIHQHVNDIGEILNQMGGFFEEQLEHSGYLNDLKLEQSMQEIAGLLQRVYERLNLLEILTEYDYRYR